MAASSPNPGGFSYAQAAKGRASATISQSPSSKVTSGTSTPATSAFPESSAGGNWADEVEVVIEEKREAVSPSIPQHRVDHVSSKVSLSEPAPSEPSQSKPVENDSTELSSTPIAMSNEDDTKQTANPTSHEASWELKSQSSDPAWIAERKERQNAAQTTEPPSVREDKKSKDSTTPASSKPAVLQDAPLPSVNPWMKRAEESKARIAPQPSPAPTAVASTAAAPPSVSPHDDEQNKLKNSNPALKTTTETSVAKEASSTVPVNGDATVISKPVPESKKPSFSKTAGEGATPSLPKAAAPTTSRLVIKDEISWPTPDSAPDKDRKGSETQKENDKLVDETTPTSTKSKKKEWMSMVVTPNIIFETQNIRGREAPRGGERGSRGAPRSRGGGRGAAFAGERTGRTRDTENSTQRSTSNPNDTEGTVSNARPTRNGSANAVVDRVKEHHQDRNTHSDRRANSKRGPLPNLEIAEASVTATDARITRSPRNVPDIEASNNTENRPVAAVPRHTTDSPTVESDHPAARSTNLPNRKDSRPIEEGRDVSYHLSNRGSKRGGRGRGGSREFANGHQSSQPYVNGQSSMDLQAANSSFMTPASPAFQNGRGNLSFPLSHQGRGGWSRGSNTRAPSLPVESLYPRFAAFGPQSNVPPVQTSFFPGPYDYQGYPMTSVPYQTYMDQQYLLGMVGTQLEYYFCTDNLLKDLFLRKSMDSQGFVFLRVIANFNRIKQLTTDLDIIRTCCIASENIEICVGEDGEERLRKREGWEQFVLPIEHRNEAARTEGAQQLRQPDRPQLASWNASPFRGLANSRPHRGDRRSYDASVPSLNGFAPSFNGFIPGQENFEPTMNGDNNARGRSVKPAVFESSPGVTDVNIPTDEIDNEPDAFPDEQTSDLTVIVKMNHQRPPHHSNSSRTFSNGSIDSRNISAEIERKPNNGVNGNSAEKESKFNGNGTISRGPSPAKDRNADDEISLFWMKDQNVPSEGLPSDVTLEPYTSLRLKALEQRAHAATGTCPYDLDVLYQFWCHFLIRNFNNRMYADFKYYANADARDRHSFVGLQNLVKFFAQSLLSQSTIRHRVLQDYILLVNSEPAKLEGSAFKQLRSAWRNGALNLKNRKKLADMVDTTLRERLEA